MKNSLQLAPAFNNSHIALRAALRLNPALHAWRYNYSYRRPQWEPVIQPLWLPWCFYALTTSRFIQPNWEPTYEQICAVKTLKKCYGK